MTQNGREPVGVGMPGVPTMAGSRGGGEQDRSFQCLLDLDPDLADELDPDARRVARAAATALTFGADPGPLELDRQFAAVAGGPGLVVIHGVVVLSVRVGDRVTAELIGAGDLLQPVWEQADQLLARDVAWRTLAPVRFAVLDDAFSRRVRFWPQLTQALVRRAGRRVVNLDMQRAIAAHPRLEVRLALLLWHLAGRWGKVERGGVRLCLPLTHQLLGQLISAERPSVSHALARLSHIGLITGHGDEWHLHGSVEEFLPAMAETGRAEHIVASVDAFRRAQAAS